MRAGATADGPGILLRRWCSQGADAHVQRTGSSPSWLMMTSLGSSRDGVAMLAGLELGRACALVLPASPGKG